MPTRIITKHAPKVGTGCYLRYDALEREDDGQGAEVGRDEVLRYSPTLEAARGKARELLASGTTAGTVTLLVPREYIQITRE